MSKHADEIPILLHMRNRFLRSASTYPSDLRALDKRLAANLEGLAIAGDDGWRAAVALFEDRPEPATITAVANLAYFHGNDLYLAYLRDALGTDHSLIEMAAFGLSWLGSKRVNTIVESLWLGENDTDTATALACSLIYDVRPDARALGALFTQDEPVGLWAIKVAGWYNLQSALPHIIAAKSEGDPLVAMACDMALVLLRQDPTAIHRILTNALTNTYDQLMSIEVALHELDPDQRMQWWNKQDDPDLRLRTAYIISDRRCVPWLLDQCDEGIDTDEAIECIRQITSVDVEDMISSPVSDKIADPFVSVQAASQNPKVKLAMWWRAARDKIPDGPTIHGKSIDQISLEEERMLPLSVQQTIALHNRLRRDAVGFPIGRSPYLSELNA